VNPSIKCNLENNTLSEWSVALQNEGTLDGRSAPAVLTYDFVEHEDGKSSVGATYQRLDVRVYVKREFANMMISIVGPTALLSLCSLSAFSLDIFDSRGVRLLGIACLLDLIVVLVRGSYHTFSFVVCKEWVVFFRQKV
jgi:hypothetical protein